MRKVLKWIGIVIGGLLALIVLGVAAAYFIVGERHSARRDRSKQAGREVAGRGLGNHAARARFPVADGDHRKQKMKEAKKAPSVTLPVTLSGRLQAKMEAK